MEYLQREIKFTKVIIYHKILLNNTNKNNLLGFYFNNKKAGKGLLKFEDGSISIGTWKSNKEEGLLINYDKDGKEELFQMERGKRKYLIDDKDEIEKLKRYDEYQNLIRFYYEVQT